MFKYIILALILFGCDNSNPVADEPVGDLLGLAVSSNNNLEITHTTPSGDIVSVNVDSIYNYEDTFLMGDFFELNVTSDSNDEIFKVFVLINNAVIFSQAGDRLNPVSFRKDF